MFDVSSTVPVPDEVETTSQEAPPMPNPVVSVTRTQEIGDVHNSLQDQIDTLSANLKKYLGDVYNSQQDQIDTLGANLKNTYENIKKLCGWVEKHESRIAALESVNPFLRKQEEE